MITNTLESLENGTELIVCTEEQIQKLPIYFELKKYLSLINISYPLNIDYFLWVNKSGGCFLKKWLLCAVSSKRY